MRLPLFATLFTAALALPAFAADEPARWTDGLLVAGNGMTVYTFDKDAPGKSACADNCLKVWPALAATADAAVKAPFGVLRREDGSMQLSFNDKPLYLYAADSKAGDTTGDKMGGVWHVVRKDQRSAAAAAPTRGGNASEY